MPGGSARSRPKLGELSFRVLQPHETERLSALLALYTSALPAHEQKPRAELERMFGSKGYVFLVAEHAEQLAGFAILYRLSSARPVLLEYLAVEAQLRSGGVGAQLFVLSAWCAGERPLLVEIDAPVDDESTRRLRFYQKQGCRRVEAHPLSRESVMGPLVYILPLAELMPPPMWLLTRQSEPITVPELETWLRALYVEVYGCAMDDPRIAQMLERSTDK